MATAWQTPPTFTALQIVTHTDLNKLGSDLIAISESDSCVLGRASSDSSTSSATYVNVSGASVTLNRAGQWFLFISFNGKCNLSGDSGLVTYTDNSGADSAYEILVSGNEIHGYDHHSLITITSPPKTIQLRYKRVTGSIFYFARATSISAIWIGP